MNSVNTTRKKILYRASHRGTKEMDCILGKFVQDNLTSFSQEDFSFLQRLIAVDDLDLFSWIMGKESPPLDIQSHALFQKLLASVCRDP